MYTVDAVNEINTVTKPYNKNCINEIGCFLAAADSETITLAAAQ